MSAVRARIGGAGAVSGLHGSHGMLHSAGQPLMVGARGEPTTSITSPGWAKPKNQRASVGLALTQPCDTLLLPCELTDHGAECTNVPPLVNCTAHCTFW